MVTDPTVIDDDLGYTSLQADIFDRLRRADIPDSYINSILGIVAAGERERQFQDDVEQLWERYREPREPLNEAEGDEYAEAYLRWMESTR